MVKKFFSILLAGTIIFSLSACGKTSTEENQNISSGDSMQTESESTSAESISSDETDGETGKTLVAYFSWSGNTKEMASYIAEQTGGDVFEIQPATPYPEDYQETGDIAKEECDNNARPEVLNMLEDLYDYDTLFIGYPIWWHATPAVINSFLESYDLKGKLIIPFCTSGGSDIDETMSTFLDSCEGLAVYGEQCINSVSDIDSWLKELGLN